MKTSALLMMVGSWSVITYFTVRFFLKVLKTSQSSQEEGGGGRS